MGEKIILDKEWYTYHQAAKLCGSYKQLIKYYADMSKIKSRKINGISHVHVSDVEKLIKGEWPPKRKPKPRKKPSKIIIYNNCIGIIANNTGNEFLFDLDMYPILSGFGWNEKKRNGYLQATIGNKTVLAHHLVFGKPPIGYTIDHKDGNKRNNFLSNLRIASISENAINSKKMKNNTSGYKGVVWISERKKWRSNITCKGKTIFLGYFKTPEDAAKAYDEAAEKYFGDFAKTNKKLGLL